MYAIIRDGGRQFKVEVGTEFQMDYRLDMKEGDEVVFEDVLAIRTDEKLLIGQPSLNAKVVAVVTEALSKGPKLVVQKFRRRKTLRKRTGHRQKYVLVQVKSIDQE